MQHARILECVEAIARFGSVRRAADNLNVASSALNRRLLDLERELGTALFNRHARGMTPTAAGELFVGHARSTLDDLNRARTEIARLGALAESTINIVALQAVIGDLLPDVIAEFHSNNPHTLFSVIVAGNEAATEAIASGQADVAILFNPEEHPAMRVVAKFEQQMCAVVTPSHPLANCQSVRVTDCVPYPIAFADSALVGRLLITEILERSPAKLTPTLVSNSFEMMRNFVYRTNGVCFQIRAGVQHLVQRGSLKAIPLAETDARSRSLVIAVSSQASLDPVLQLFVESLRDSMLQTTTSGHISKSTS